MGFAREVFCGETLGRRDVGEGVEAADGAGLVAAQPGFGEQAGLLQQDGVELPPGRVGEGYAELDFGINESAWCLGQRLTEMRRAHGDAGFLDDLAVKDEAGLGDAHQSGLFGEKFVGEGQGVVEPGEGVKAAE